MKVLIAVEDNVYGHAIAEFVTSHTWPLETQFRVIHAIRTQELAAYMTGDAICCKAARALIQRREEYSRALVQSVATDIRSRLPQAEIHEEVIYGNPKDVILDEADAWKADIIVLGSHGRTGLDRFLLGSVSISVLSHANQSVMIVKLPAEKEPGPSKSRTATAAANY